MNEKCKNVRRRQPNNGKIKAIMVGGTKDLRTGVETSDYKAVLDGDIDMFLAAALAGKVGESEKDN